MKTSSSIIIWSKRRAVGFVCTGSPGYIGNPVSILDALWGDSLNFTLWTMSKTKSHQYWIQNPGLLLIVLTTNPPKSKKPAPNIIIALLLSLANHDLIIKIGRNDYQGQHLRRNRSIFLFNQILQSIVCILF